jgi:low temperature requirement protein LtrA
MRKVLNLALLLAFQFCYLHWPPNNSMFIYNVAYELLTNTNHLVDNLMHPIILLGIGAQILLLLGAILPDFNSKFNTFSVLLLGTLVLLFLVVGILSANFKIIISTVPFLGMAVLYFAKLKSK